jgi:hypothetical protein
MIARDINNVQRLNVCIYGARMVPLHALGRAAHPGAVDAGQAGLHCSQPALPLARVRVEVQLVQAALGAGLHLRRDVLAPVATHQPGVLEGVRVRQDQPDGLDRTAQWFGAAA